MFSTIGLLPGAENRRRFLDEVTRVLKPGGTFVIHVHNRLRTTNLTTPWGISFLVRTYLWDPLFTDLEVGDRVMPFYRGIRDMYIHIFSFRELKRLLGGAGFEITRVAYLNDRRSDEIRDGLLASWRANGFVVSCRLAR